jgi:signal peptidase II
MLSGADKGKPRHITVIANHFDFIYTLNPGGAWSFLRTLPENFRRPFFLFVSSAAIVFIISVYRRLHPEQWAMRWGLPLALGGAIGNLVDRVRYGSVIDFSDMYAGEGTRLDKFIERFTGANPGAHHWPTYNVADIAIVIGVLLMAIDTFSGRKAPPHEPAKPPSSTDPPEAPVTTAASEMEPVAEAPGSVLEAMPKE